VSRKRHGQKTQKKQKTKKMKIGFIVILHYPKLKKKVKNEKKKI
jgi:hypothetical protein